MECVFFLLLLNIEQIYLVFRNFICIVNSRWLRLYLSTFWFAFVDFGVWWVYSNKGWWNLEVPTCIQTSKFHLNEGFQAGKFLVMMIHPLIHQVKNGGFLASEERQNTTLKAVMSSRSLISLSSTFLLKDQDQSVELQLDQQKPQERWQNLVFQILRCLII